MGNASAPGRFWGFQPQGLGLTSVKLSSLLSFFAIFGLSAAGGGLEGQNSGFVKSTFLDGHFLGFRVEGVRIASPVRTCGARNSRLTKGGGLLVQDHTDRNSFALAD